MVSISGVTTAVPLLNEYNALSLAISTAQSAVSANATISFVQASAIINGQTVGLSAAIPLSATDSATILNSLITIWTNMQNSLSTQITGIT